MRPIHLAQLDKARPVLAMSRELVRPYVSPVTVAPITTTIRGLSTEVRVGLDHGSVVSCDNLVTILTAALGRQLGLLLAHQEEQLSAAVRAAFDLE